MPRRMLFTCRRCGLTTNRLKGHIRQMHRKQYKLEENTMLITDETLSNLSDVLEEIVNDSGSGTWREKKEHIIDNIGPLGKSVLEEFTSWFDEEDFS